MYVFKQIVLCIFFGLSFSAAVAADDDAEMSYYDISGQTAKELRAAINAARPGDKRGKRFDGYTTWHVSWKYRFKPDGADCVLSSFDTVFRAKVVLPRWRAGERGDSALARNWQRYIKVLTQHEFQHLAHGQSALREIRALRTMRSSSGCRGFADQVNARADAVIKKYQDADSAFDRRTRHGYADGAYFP